MARTLPSVLGAGVFGALAVYLMINPAKASYSVAPTMALCAVAGFLTALWLAESRRSVLLIALIGLLLGASVNFRLPNALLAAGYFLFFGIPFLWTRSLATFVQGLAFGAGVLVGMAPTLARPGHQCRQSAGDDLWRRRRGRAGLRLRRTWPVSARHADRPDRACDRRDALAVVRRARRHVRQAGLRRCRQPRRQSRLLPEPSDLHAVLRRADRDAVAVDAVVCPAAAAGRGA